VAQTHGVGYTTANCEGKSEIETLELQRHAERGKENVEFPLEEEWETIET